jgi:hypothetical protein
MWMPRKIPAYYDVDGAPGYPPELYPPDDPPRRERPTYCKHGNRKGCACCKPQEKGK